MCATETRPAHPRSFLQDRRARLHLLYTTPVLLSHHWLLTCSRVACCLARAHACGIEPSRPLAKHFRSHSRTRRFYSARTSGFCNTVPLSTCCDTIKAGLPPLSVLRCASNPRCVTPAPTASCRCVASPSNSPHHICHLCLRKGRDLPASEPRLPLSSAPSCHVAAPPHTCACAFQHREPHA
jgi:hypothetical protein